MPALLAISPARSCGGCTVCCRAPAIAPLGKPAGEPCQYLGDCGCSVYHQRGAAKFADCVSFTCLWLQGKHLTDDRPDKLGVVFMAKPDCDVPGQERIFVTEMFPGAAENSRVRELIRGHVAEGRTVAISNEKFVVAVRPGGHSWRYEIDPEDSLHSRIDPRIAPVQLTAYGRPVARPSIPSP